MHKDQKRIFILLLCLITAPFGAVFLIFSKNFSVKEKISLSTLVVFSFFLLFGLYQGNLDKTLAAHKMWENGNRNEAVAVYKRLIFNFIYSSGDYRVYQRTLEHLQESASYEELFRIYVKARKKNLSVRVSSDISEKMKTDYQNKYRVKDKAKVKVDKRKSLIFIFFWFVLFWMKKKDVFEGKRLERIFSRDKINLAFLTVFLVFLVNYSVYGSGFNSYISGLKTIFSDANIFYGYIFLVFMTPIFEERIFRQAFYEITEDLFCYEDSKQFLKSHFFFFLLFLITFFTETFSLMHTFQLFILFSAAVLLCRKLKLSFGLCTAFNNVIFFTLMHHKNFISLDLIQQVLAISVFMIFVSVLNLLYQKKGLNYCIYYHVLWNVLSLMPLISGKL